MVVGRVVARMPTYVITGCSGGIGLGLVRALAARGDKVYATVRKRETTATGEDLISKVPGDVTILEGIDVTSDDVGAKLSTALDGVKVDVIVHNAGGIANRDGPDAPKGMDAFADGGGGPMGAKVDNLKNVTVERMLAAFQVNTIGPLRVQQALTDKMGEGGKVLIISSGMGSITDNGSGGLYAYRTAKAAVNMVMRNMSLGTSTASEPVPFPSSSEPGSIRPIQAPYAPRAARILSWQTSRTAASPSCR